MCRLFMGLLLLGITSSTALANWADNTKIGADLRYRHQYIGEENSPDRNRHRIRARVGLSGQVNDDIKVGMRFASGGGSITSTNQDLDDAGANKAFDIDLAYFDWSLMESVRFVGGKMKNPLLHPGSSDIIWDGDLTPEGLAVTYDNKSLFFNLSTLWLKERSTQADSGLLAAQVAYKMPISGDVSLQVGAAAISFTGLKGETVLGSSKGNSVTGSGDSAIYDNEFSLSQAFVVFGFKVMEMPATLFVDVVSNSEPTDNNQAYLAGFSLGNAKEVGSMAFIYDYRQVEKDAVLGALNDGDFNGGNTDGKGHRLTVKYALAKNSKVAFQYYDNDKGIDSPISYKKAHLDLILKF